MSVNPEDLATVQDDTRERQMRELFGLLPSGQGRMGADAVDEHGNPFELKSATKTGVTTGRDLGIHTLQRYRTRYWIICKGIYRRTGFDIEECRFLSPAMLEDWFGEIEARLAPDLAILDRVLTVIAEAGFAEAELNRLDYLVKRGLTLNNPKIPWHYIQSRGIRIEGNPREHLRQLVSAHPLR